MTRVIVTGADGFIGSHLCEELVLSGHEVTAFCLYNSFGSRGWVDALPDDVVSQMHVIFGDVRDSASVSAAVQGMEIVYHLAALIAIPHSYTAYRSYFDTNLNGTLNVLEASLRAGVSRIVQTSTSEVYGSPDTVPIRETHPLRAQSPYSASKIAADKACEAWACSFQAPVVTIRPFNTYGPRQSLRAIIPVVLSQLLAGRKTVTVGSVHPQRDFTFVKDTASGLALGGTANLKAGELVQLGTGRTVSVADVIQISAKLLGVECEIAESADRLRPANSEVDVLLSDPTRAKELMGWEPKISLEEGLERLAEWMQPLVAKMRIDDYHT